MKSENNKFPRTSKFSTALKILEFAKKQLNLIQFQTFSSWETLSKFSQINEMSHIKKICGFDQISKIKKVGNISKISILDKMVDTKNK